MSEELYVKAECVPETLPAGLSTSIGLVSSPMTGTRYAGFWPLAAIDLSAPPLDGAGMPTRLDALPWACMIIACRLQEGWSHNRLGMWSCAIENEGPHEDLRPQELHIFCDGEHVATIVPDDHGMVTSGFPMLAVGVIAAGVWAEVVDQGNPEDIAAAIVAAALRARVGLPEEPDVPMCDDPDHELDDEGVCDAPMCTSKGWA